MYEIRKRNGQIVPFEAEKITQAIFKSYRATGNPNREEASRLCIEVIEHLETGKIYDVETIQDIVEKVLYKSAPYNVTKAFILYRSKRENIRSTKDLLSNLDLIDNYLSLADWRVKESANTTFSLQGLNQHISSIVSSEYWLNRIYPTEVKEAHSSGALHIHDLGFLSVYCVGWDLQDLLMSGFTGVNDKIQCRPAKYLRTALGQIVNFFYTMQGEAAGAQAFSNFDTYLCPFIRYNKLSYKNVVQCLQEFIYNVNVPTRVGFQTPFTNVTMDLKIPQFMKDQPVIVGGKVMDDTYGDFQEEMDVFNKAFVEVMSEGDANNAVFSFPIPTYNVGKDFDWNNPINNKIFEMTGKYGIPYFSNFINSSMQPDDVRSMCCRLRLDKRELQNRGGGLFGSNPLTGSVGVVTINLPRLGYLSKNIEDLKQRLRKLMDIGKNSLEIKRKTIETLTDKGLFPYSTFYLRNIKAKSGKYWDNHFSTIGLVGMNECCVNFIGKDITSDEGQALAFEILNYMKDVLQEFQDETGNIYNLEATPAEGTSYRLAKLDAKIFPDIISATGNGEPFYTNSTQLPVNYTDDLFEALDKQDKLQCSYTGGTVFHTFIGEKLPNPNSIKQLVKTVFTNYKLPYLTISPTFSVCPEHGYIYGEHRECPKCKSACEVYSRIVGYMRPINHWNAGKLSEYSVRKQFDKSLNI
ncbi:MAG: ribonucleoside triphosphate reductase [Marinifilaceae bacterium]|jgi:ribonucleoside-triphosphate reductase|nr:ribonucleoside triphosphate reductase [Marinifilaceae bacterium]